MGNDTGLVGLFGHLRDEDGKIQYQFQVLRPVGQDRYLIQFFSWIDGRETTVTVVSEEKLLGPGCTLYALRDEWCHQHDVEAMRGA
jgi:hypothetical protein